MTTESSPRTATTGQVVCTRMLLVATAGALVLMSFTFVGMTSSDDVFGLLLLGGFAWLSVFGTMMWIVDDAKSGGCLGAVAVGLAVLALQQRVGSTDNEILIPLKVALVCGGAAWFGWAVWALAGPELVATRSSSGRRGLGLGAAIAVLLVTAWLVCPPLPRLLID